MESDFKNLGAFVASFEGYSPDLEIGVSPYPGDEREKWNLDYLNSVLERQHKESSDKLLAMAKFYAEMLHLQGFKIQELLKINDALRKMKGVSDFSEIQSEIDTIEQSVNTMREVLEQVSRNVNVKSG